MSIVARKVSDRKAWTTAVSNTDGGTVTPAVIKEFAPSGRDEDWLSLFEVEEEKDLVQIAAAFAIRTATAENAFFVYVQSDDFVSSRFTLRATDGGLLCSRLDAMHREMHIPDVEAAIKTSKLFLAGEPFFVEQKNVLAGVDDLIKTNAWDISVALSKGRPQVGLDRLSKLLKDRQVRIM